jgi:hypothetical protein
LVCISARGIAGSKIVTLLPKFTLLLSLAVEDAEEDARDDGAIEDDVMGADEDVIGADDEPGASDEDLLDGAAELEGAAKLEGAAELDGADDEAVPPLRLPYTSNSHRE